MVAVDFISGFGSLAYTSVQDYSEIFNFDLTIIVLSLCTAIVTVKQYILNPITCYISTEIGGSNILNYVENYCWVQGTLPINYEGRIPNGDSEWRALDRKKILYYQWVPFVLGIQCILFFVPKLIWRAFCYNQADLESIIKKSVNAAAQACPDNREGIVAEIASSIEQLTFQKHRREKQTYNPEAVLTSHHPICNFQSRAASCFRSHIVITYLFVKLLCVINAIGQLFMMQTFLGFNDSAAPFGIRVLIDIIRGHDWQETQVFPRIGYCFVQMKILGVQTNGITAQCALPVNMLNEKIYIFLWWWILLASLLSLYSLLIWLSRNCNRRQEENYVLKYLKLAPSVDIHDESDVYNFCQFFLCRDGMFLLRMIRINSGDIVASEVINLLWERNTERRNDKEVDDFTNKKNLSKMLVTLPLKDEESDYVTKPNVPSQTISYPNLENQFASSDDLNKDKNTIV